MTLNDIRKAAFALKDLLGCSEITIKVSPEFLASLDKAIAEDNTGVKLPEQGDSIIINIESNTGNVSNRKFTIREINIIK